MMEQVALVGPLLGAIPAVLIALSTGGTRVIWVVLAIVTIQLLQNTLLTPRVMRKAVGVNPLVTLLAIAAFGSLLGLAGVVLAIPMAAILQTLLDRFVLGPAALPLPAGRDRMSSLRLQAQELAQDVLKRVRGKEVAADNVADQVENAMEAIINDLDSVLAELAPAEVGR